MKRIFAILLSIVMSLGMGFSAYALPEEETPIDIEFVDEYSYTDKISSDMSISNNTATCKSVVRGDTSLAMAIGASAADSFSFYISNTGAVTSKVISAGNAAQDDYVKVNYRIDNITNATSVSYRTTVGGSYVASGSVSNKGNHTIKHSNSTYIDKGERILCTMTLNPAPSGVGSQASGYVKGK